MIADIDEKKMNKVVKKTCVQRRKICLLKDVKIRKRFEEKSLNLLMLERQICGYISRMGF